MSNTGAQNIDQLSNRTNVPDQCHTPRSILRLEPDVLRQVPSAKALDCQGFCKPPKHHGTADAIGLLGFLIALHPLSCNLMGLRGSDDYGFAIIGVIYFQGGLLMLLGGIMAWLTDDGFTAVAFCTFGGFFLAYGATLDPSSGAISYYSASPAKPYDGLQAPGFNSTIAFWLLFMAVAVLLFLFCALRTNIVYVLIFACEFVALLLLTGTYFLLANDYEGNEVLARRIEKAAGGLLFIVCLAGWYDLTHVMFAMVEMPISLPLGDLSNTLQRASAI